MSKQSQRYLIVDGQILQSAARDRGMGRYSEYLLASIMHEAEYTAVYVILAEKDYDPTVNTEVLRQTFDSAKIIRLDLLSTVRNRLQNAEIHNKKVLNDFIASLGVDPSKTDFLIPSPFQEPIVSVFPDATNNFVVFYDLIPYLYHQRYSKRMPFENYLRRFKLLFEADRLLTISQAVRDDLAVYLGIPHSRTSAIDGAAIKSKNRSVPPSSIEPPERFILMPTSDDLRKNNLRAVLGFEEFRVRTNSDLKLVITSKINRIERERLQSFSKNTIFTGNVAEAELDWLYEQAEAVLFTPESEGLGLPILEAVQVNKRVVCSSIDAFKEISKQAFYYCDHEDQYSIAGALESALGGEDRRVPAEEYAHILKHYSWRETAKRAIRAMRETHKRNRVAKPKIAIFAPAPDGFSAVGKVVAESHAVLSEYFDIDYFIESGYGSANTRPDYLRYVANCYAASSFSVKLYGTYQAVFYHIGNSEYHLESITNSLYLPGYIILHDTNISDAYRVMVEQGVISKERAELEAHIATTGKLSLSKYLASVVSNQLGVVTHSDYAVSATEEVMQGHPMPARKINLATQAPQVVPERTYERLRLGMAGIIADIKGIEVIESLAKDPRYQDHTLAIFGYNYAPTETIDRLRSHDNIDLTTNLSDFDFVNSMRKLDIFVNYRMQYQGETSLSTLEAMRQGVVVVVRNVGWYAELPDDVVVKVENPEELLEKLHDLVSRPDKLQEISKKAVTYVTQYHSHEQYAEGMLRMLDDHKSAVGRTSQTARLLKSGKVTSSTELVRRLRAGDTQ